MSTCIIAQDYGLLWIGDHNPGSNEIPAAGSINVNNNFMNSTTFRMFQCVDATPNAQVWIPLNPDWNSSSGPSQILNKPALSKDSTG